MTVHLVGEDSGGGLGFLFFFFPFFALPGGQVKWAQ